MAFLGTKSSLRKEPREPSDERDTRVQEPPWLHAKMCGNSVSHRTVVHTL